MPRLSADARRHHLLDAALSVAEDRGIGNVSLRAVAEAAGGVPRVAALPIRR
jgi:AcrR family transcriptional regulator